MHCTILQYVMNKFICKTKILMGTLPQKTCQTLDFCFNYKIICSKEVLLKILNVVHKNIYKQITMLICVQKNLFRFSEKDKN